MSKNEFASASYTVGQLNAIIKLLKKQGGEDGPERYLRGELSVSVPSGGNFISHTVRVNRSRIPQAAPDVTGRKQCTNPDVVSAVPKSEGDEKSLYYDRIFNFGPLVFARRHVDGSWYTGWCTDVSKL